MVPLVIIIIIIYIITHKIKLARLRKENTPKLLKQIMLKEQKTQRLIPIKILWKQILEYIYLKLMYMKLIYCITMK